MPNPSTHPCPKCNRTLIQDGEPRVGDVALPTFQCDECIMNVEFLGEKMELPLTFCPRAVGSAFDPAGEEPV